MRKKISDYIADFIANQGVEHVFTVTGGGAMHLNDSFGHNERLHCIYNHHEQACAIAAEGYARLTNKVAAVCVTSGPGGTNAITGVLGGWQDSIPMFIVSGQVKRETTTWSTDIPLRQLGDQEFQIVDCVKGMTKYAVMVTEPEKIRYYLEKAWFLCNHGRKGPVWLDIPLDIQAAIIDTENLEGYNEAEDCTEVVVYDNSYTKKILEQVAKAKCPVILAGTGVRLGNAYKEFLEVMNRLKIPVVTAWNAHDLLPEECPYYCGRPGTVGLRGGNFVVQNSDLLIVMGCRLNIRQISYYYQSFAKNAYKIMIDIDKNELVKPTISIDMPIHANIKDVLSDMALTVSEDYFIGEHYKWLRWAKEIHEKYPAVLPEYRKKEEPINPYVFIENLSELLEEKDNIICGNGSACVVTFQAAKIKSGQRMFTNSGCAAMGYGFPAALGCAVARKGERVICIDGDGSFQMNIQELQTVVHHRLNLKIFIINNNGYHSIRQTQTNLFQGQLVGVCGDNGISFPDLEKIAFAYGIPFLRITTERDIKENVPQMLNADGPWICEVVVDEKQNFEPKLSSKVLEDGRIVSPEIDDMFPFLPKEEYEANHLPLEGSVI